MADLQIEIGAKIDNLKKALNDADGQLKAFGKRAVSVGQTLSLALTAPLTAFAGLSIKVASDTEETFSKFATVFRDVEKSGEAAFKTLREEYGLSSLSAKRLLSDTGDLLTGFGFTQESALDLSLQVNKLAVDLASFTNFSGGAEGASQALTKALLGERESVKALGIAILEEDVNKQVAINTAKGLTFATEREAKAFATLDIAVSQSQNAIGDYERTSESFANQQRLLFARLSDVTAQLGEVLLPIATKVTTKVTELVTSFSALEPSTKKIIVVIGALVAGIGPALIAFGALLQILPLLSVGFAALTGPIGLIVAAVAGAATLIIINFDEIKRNLQILSLEFISTAIDIAKGLDLIATAIPGFSAVTKGAIAGLQVLGERVAKDIVEGLSTDGVKGVEDFKNGLEGLNLTLDKTAQKIGSIGIVRTPQTAITGGEGRNPFANAVGSPTPSGGVDATSRSFGVGDLLANITNSLDSQIPGVIDRLVTFAQNVNNILKNEVAASFTDLGFSIGEALTSGGNVIKAIGQSLLDSIGAFLGQLGQQLIAYGVAGIAFGKLTTAIAAGGPLSVGAGIAAIAAGAALVAISGGIRGLANKGVSGVGSGGGGSFGGGSGQTLSNSSISGSFDRNIALSGAFRVEGRDLVYVIDQERRRN
jgi:hypothetical protein